MAEAKASIREAIRPGDLGAVAALHGTLYAQEYGMDVTMEAYVAIGLGELALAWQHEGDRAAGRIWVAELDGRIVGAAAMVRGSEAPGWGQLRWVVLDPAARGHGVGRALFEAAMGEARERGYQGVYLWTIAGLDAAHHLYKSAGFRVTHSEPARKWGVDAVEQRMELRFDGA
ncbi:GNAT family N-acetyltransferase [Yinghuangia soli]|uniref:GNAT family N-acetyltransferase n=1 Tax=Yinghuangia soli TaxID=2908204 RepID=A0AA41Q4N8_9ACTN|nr:GNAT family N-acetyltransferase [Yinghuangia soli]MCF2530915.1 GNAT family N-acetyltransferase [Yinghuangia soli]